MANITFEGAWTHATTPVGAALVHRLRVLARAWRLGRARRARMRLVRSEMRDPRWYADIGLDMDTYRRHDWLGEMVRAMGGRM